MITFEVEHLNYLGWWMRATSIFDDLDKAETWITNMQVRHPNTQYRIKKHVVTEEIL